MKTLLSILLVSLIGISASADPGSKSDYIVTKDGKCVVAKVQFGLFKIHAKQVDGNMLKLNFKDIATYQRNGILYEKKPLYNENKNTGSMVFMRMVSWRNGLGLYCYDDACRGVAAAPRYFVFKDTDTYWLEVDQMNSETITSFFDRLAQK